MMGQDVLFVTCQPYVIYHPSFRTHQQLAHLNPLCFASLCSSFEKNPAAPCQSPWKPWTKMPGRQLAGEPFQGAFPFCICVEKGVVYISLLLEGRWKCIHVTSHGAASKSYHHNKGNSFSLPAQRVICLFIGRQAC